MKGATRSKFQGSTKNRLPQQKVAKESIDLDIITATLTLIILRNAAIVRRLQPIQKWQVLKKNESIVQKRIMMILKEVKKVMIALMMNRVVEEMLLISNTS